jgi:hypothetical protein
MGRQKRSDDQTDAGDEKRGIPIRLKAPWYFEATLKQEMNLRKSRRERLRGILKGAIRFGVPALGIMVLAIVAVAGFKRETPSVERAAPAVQVQNTTPAVQVEERQVPEASEKPEAPRPIAKNRSVSSRSPKGEAAAAQRNRNEKGARPEVVPAISVTIPLNRPGPPALSLPPADPAALESSGVTIVMDSLAPTSSGTVDRDSTQAPSDTARAGIDSSEIREQHQPSSNPER